MEALDWAKQHQRLRWTELYIPVRHAYLHIPFGVSVIPGGLHVFLVGKVRTPTGEVEVLADDLEQIDRLRDLLRQDVMRGRKIAALDWRGKTVDYWVWQPSCQGRSESIDRAPMTTIQQRILREFPASDKKDEVQASFINHVEVKRDKMPEMKQSKSNRFHASLTNLKRAFSAPLLSRPKKQPLFAA